MVIELATRYSPPLVLTFSSKFPQQRNNLTKRVKFSTVQRSHTQRKAPNNKWQSIKRSNWRIRTVPASRNYSSQQLSSILDFLSTSPTNFSLAFYNRIPASGVGSWNFFKETSWQNALLAEKRRRRSAMGWTFSGSEKIFWKKFSISNTENIFDYKVVIRVYIIL